MKILFLSNYLPYPADTGTKMRSLNFLKFFSQKGGVTLVCPVSAEERLYLPQVQNYCEKIMGIDSSKFGPNRKRRIDPSFAARIHNFIHMQPWSLFDFISPEFQNHLLSLRNQNFDLIFVRYAQLAYYLLTDRRFQGWLHKTVIDVDDVDIIKQERSIARMPLSYAKLRWVIDLFFLKRYFAKVKKVSSAIVASKKDREYLAGRAYAQKVFVVPNTVDTRGASGNAHKEDSTPNHSDILFCGTMSFPHNEEAALWFAERIFPIILKKIPQVRLFVVGKNPTKNVLKLASHSHVSVAASVPSMKPFYDQAAVVVVPLLNGAGTRIKILEAMSYSKPVVSTSIGAEGLDIQAGENIIIADEPEEFAEQCVRLLQNPHERTALGLKAYDLVKNSYDHSLFIQRMDEIMETYQKEAALCPV